MIRIDSLPSSLARLSPTSAWLPIVAAAITLQLAFWFLINPLFNPPSLPPNVVVKEADVARIDSPELSALESADFETQTLTWTGCCEPAHYALRHRFELTGPPQPLGLIPLTVADNYFVYVNGHEIQRKGRLAPTATYHGMRKVLLRLPSDVLNEGTNELVIMTARNFAPYTDFLPPILGDFDELLETTRSRLFVMHEFKLGSGFLLGLIAILALVLLPRIENKAFGLWLALLASAWCMRSFFYLWYDFPFAPEVRYLYFFCVSNGLTLAWFCFIDAWTGSARRALRIIAVAAYAGVVATIAALIMLRGGDSFDSASWITDRFMLLGVLAAFARLAWHLATSEEGRVWEVAAFVLCFTGLFADISSEIFASRNWGYVNRIVPFFALALVSSLAARNLRLYQSMTRFNASLKQMLLEREQEIRDKLQQLQETEKARSLEAQRARIMRDMHDGIGGHLVRLLSAFQNKNIRPDEVELELQRSLNELRLLIDSLDDLGDNLPVALGNFRMRMEPILSRLQQSGSNQ